MPPVSRILAAVALCTVAGLLLAATGTIVPPLVGPLMLGPGIVTGAALANRWTFALHALTAFLTTFLTAAAVGFLMSAPALAIAAGWAVMFVLALLLAIPFRLVRGARTRVAPEPTTRAERRRAASQAKVESPKSKIA